MLDSTANKKAPAADIATGGNNDDTIHYNRRILTAAQEERYRAYLADHGVTSEQIRQQQDAGNTLATIAAAVQRAIDDGSWTGPSYSTPYTLNTISAAALQDTDLPPIQFVVNGLIPHGLSLVASPPKFGKSWLSLQLGTVKN